MDTWRPRYDRIRVRLDKSQRVVDPTTGYLSVWGTVVSANQFLEYNKVDGAEEDGWIEFVPESTVFDEEAIATLVNAPVTLHHPPEMLDSANTDRYQVGSVVQVKRDGDKLRALHLITAQRAIDAINEDGIFELSPGYSANIDETPGSFNGRSYRTRQAGRVYNHESIVPDARAGSQNKLDGNRGVRMDGLLISQPTTDEDNRMAEEQTTYDLGDESFADLPPAIVQHIQALEARLQQADGEEPKDEKDEEPEKKDQDEEEEEEEEDSTKSKPRGDALTRSEFNRAVKGIYKSVVEANQKTEKDRTDAAKERETVIEAAKGHLPASFRADGKTSADIMYQAIVNSNPDAKPAAERNRKDSAALRGMFAMLGTPKTDSKPIGSDGKEIKGSPSMRMDAAVKRRELRVDHTQRTFRAVGKIGLQLVQHVANTFEDAQGKVV